MYWDFAPVAERNGQIGPVWILEPTVTRVIMSVQDRFRRPSIAHDFMVSCGDNAAIIGAKLKGALLDFVTVGGIRRLFLFGSMLMQGRRVGGKGRSRV